MVRHVQSCHGEAVSSGLVALGQGRSRSVSARPSRRGLSWKGGAGLVEAVSSGHGVVGCGMACPASAWRGSAVPAWYGTVGLVTVGLGVSWPSGQVPPGQGAARPVAARQGGAAELGLVPSGFGSVRHATARPSRLGMPRQVWFPSGFVWAWPSCHGSAGWARLGELRPSRLGTARHVMSGQAEAALARLVMRWRVRNAVGHGSSGPSRLGGSRPVMERRAAARQPCRGMPSPGASRRGKARHGSLGRACPGGSCQGPARLVWAVTAWHVMACSVLARFVRSWLGSRGQAGLGTSWVVKVCRVGAVLPRCGSARRVTQWQATVWQSRRGGSGQGLARHGMVGRGRRGEAGPGAACLVGARLASVWRGGPVTPGLVGSGLGTSRPLRLGGSGQGTSGSGMAW